MNKRIKILGCFLLIIFGGQVDMLKLSKSKNFLKRLMHCSNN